MSAAPPAQPVAAPVTAELRLVSVLFVDLVGFTSLSEVREPEDVRELLGRYFELARTIVARYAGSIEKFIGDAVMAVWGVPAAREDDAELAVRAALEVVGAVAVFGEEMGAEGLRARAGVVTGQVATRESSGEGLVVGDRVNTAARAQTAAEPGTVLVDDVTRQVTSAAIAYEDAGEHALKGKVEPLRLWRAVRVVGGIGGSEREQGLDAAFVGRERELRLLKDLFHGALERGSARLVAVSGEAGVGKSRLLREFSNYVDGLAETVLWHSGRCLSFGEGVAYWGLSEMVRQRLGIPEDASSQEASTKLEAGLERWVSEAADRSFIWPRLGALLGVAEPELGREDLFAGWRMFLERLAEREPVALVFEDLQWADAGLLAFIEHLLDWSASSRIFMLALSRPEVAAAGEGWPAGRRGTTLIRLEPLDDQAMRELLTEVVDALPEQAMQRIVAQAEGVPLYAIETLRALADRGVLAPRDGRLALESELDELDVPPSLSSLIAARLDALEPVERGLVKAMSVFGEAFPRSTAAALGDVEEERIDDVLAALVRKQVFMIRADPLSPDRGQYAFAQGVMRTVAYGMLSRQERKPRHWRAAEHLRAVFANDGEEVAEVIASHYVDAYGAAQGDPDAEQLRTEAVAALRRAGQRAATVGAPDVAKRSYLKAAELAREEAERVELTEAAGEMAMQSGELEHAIELLDAASAAYTTGGRERDAARVAGRIGQALSDLGRTEEAAERIVASLQVLGTDTLDAGVAELNSALGRAQLFNGKHELAEQPLETALRIAQALELPAVLSNALNNKAILCLWSNRIEEARLLLAGAIEIAERHDLTGALARAQGNQGAVAMEWDLPEATRDLTSAVTLARLRGDRYQEGIAIGNLMTVHLYAGRWDELEQLAAEALEGDDERPSAEDIHQRLAIMHALRGEPDAAERSLERLARCEHADDAELRAFYASAVVSVRLAQGDAQAALERGMSILGSGLETLGIANENVRQAWPDTLQAALQLDRIEDARDLVARLAARPQGHLPPYLRAQLARGRGLVAAAEANHDVVETELLASIDGFTELEYPYWRAVAQTDLAGWLIDQGRRTDAASYLEQATATLQSLHASPALARAQELLHGQPLRSRPDAVG